MKKLKSTLLLMLIVTTLLAQDGYIPSKRESVTQEKYTTYTKILNENYAKEKTYEHFEGMYTSSIPYNAFYRSLSVAYSNLGEPADSVFYYFGKAVALDCVKSCSWFELYNQRLVPQNKLVDWKTLDSVRFNHFDSVCTKCLTTFRKQLDIERNEIENDTSLNHKLIADLKTMFKDDQFYRKQMHAVNDKNDLAKLWQLQTENDTKNERKLEAIFNQYGYPTRKMVSKHHNVTAAIILLHTPTTFQRQYLSMMIKAFKEKDISVIDLTMLLDKIWSGEEGNQIFGTQSSTNGGTISKLDKSKSIKILNDLNLSELIKEL
jgi:hypothetical protein